MEYVCKCNNCDRYLIDTNPQVNAVKFDVSNLSLDILTQIDDMKACPFCFTDEYLTDIESIEL